MDVIRKTKKNPIELETGKKFKRFGENLENPIESGKIRQAQRIRKNQKES